MMVCYHRVSEGNKGRIVPSSRLLLPFEDRKYFSTHTNGRNNIKFSLASKPKLIERTSCCDDAASKRKAIRKTIIIKHIQKESADLFSNDFEQSMWST